MEEEEPPLRFQDPRCFYCEDGLSKDSCHSRWEGGQHHYKILKCDCGKDNWFKVDFTGSGHDSFVKGNDSIESRVRKVCDR